MKQSINQYRNINGKRFECFTSNPAEFAKCKKECRHDKLAFRIIDEQFYKEVKLDVTQLLLDFLKFHYKDNPFRKEETNIKDIEEFLSHNQIYN